MFILIALHIGTLLSHGKIKIAGICNMIDVKYFIFCILYVIWRVFHFVPDDHSRVVLEKEDPTDTDYINANYILVSLLKCL